nr:MAG TPA: hypothetical protein [Caudoviricetes sp.]
MIATSFAQKSGLPFLSRMVCTLLPSNSKGYISLFISTPFRGCIGRWPAWPWRARR